MGKIKKIYPRTKEKKAYTRTDAFSSICVCGCIQKLKKASMIDRSLLIHADMYLENN